MTLALDASNYTSPLTPEALAAWKAAGVELVVVQAVDPPRGYPTGQTRAQIQACVDAGFAVDAYVWLWFDLDVDDVVHKLALLDGLPIRRLWLDVEDTAALRYDYATCEAKVAAALAACDAVPVSGGKPCGVYSGRWYWADARYMGNSAAFAARDLWDAHYDGQPDAGADFAPYGGWTGVAIKQYAGTSTLAGIGNVDLDALSVDEEAALAPPVAAPARETPTDWDAGWGLSWRDAAINLKAIADALGVQLAQASTNAQTGQERDAALAQVQELQARIHTAGAALGLVA